MITTTYYHYFHLQCIAMRTLATSNWKRPPFRNATIPLCNFMLRSLDVSYLYRPTTTDRLPHTSDDARHWHNVIVFPLMLLPPALTDTQIIRGHTVAILIMAKIDATS